MSASLVYLPLDPKEPKFAEVTACQVRHEVRALFGEYPVNIIKTDIPTLRVLETIWRGSDNPWTTLIEIIERESVGIRLWEEY